MANDRNRRRDDSKGKYIIILLLICCVLVFAIGLITRNQDGDPAESQAETTEGIALSTQSTTAPPIETTETQVTEPIPVETVPVETIPAETDAEVSVSEDAGHIYIRVNREKEVELPEDFGTDVSFSISDDNVAVVDENGLLTGLQKGECIVTATSGGESFNIPVTVREMTVDSGCTYVDGILVANKSYSLPEDYDPGLLPVTEEAFAQLSSDAAAQGLNIYNSSDYRSYDFQITVYNSMVDAYGKEYADSVSARPGHSEHQTGYTIDCNSIDDTFTDTPEGKWLAEHCWEYGFIIRYPEDKVDITGYAYESWHLRYVGLEHAKAIWEQGLCLEEYLDIDSKYAE